MDNMEDHLNNREFESLSNSICSGGRGLQGHQVGTLFVALILIELKRLPYRSCRGSGRRLTPSVNMSSLALMKLS